jgi:hypothetical protein
MTTRIIRRQLSRATRALTLAAAIGAGSVVAAEHGGASATVTATPPAQASVKPLTAGQARQRCELRARQQHIGHPQRQSFIQACVKLKATS